MYCLFNLRVAHTQHYHSDSTKLRALRLAETKIFPKEKVVRNHLSNHSIKPYKILKYPVYLFNKRSEIIHLDIHLI